MTTYHTESLATIDTEEENEIPSDKKSLKN